MLTLAILSDKVSRTIRDMAKNDNSRTAAERVEQMMADASAKLAPRTSLPSTSGPVAGPSKTDSTTSYMPPVYAAPPHSRERAKFVVNHFRALTRTSVLWVVTSSTHSFRLAGAFGACAAPLSDRDNWHWKNMGGEVGQCGLYVDNLPEAVPFPNPNEESGKRSKGIAGLGSTALKALVDAILDRDNKHPIRFVRYDGPSIGKLLQCCKVVVPLHLCCFRPHPV